MDVRPQNVWPSLRFDLKAANQLVGRFLSAGFYYKTFIKPQRLWPAYEMVLARFAPGGTVGPDSDAHGYYDKRYAHADVVVAGGGPAGWPRRSPQPTRVPACCSSRRSTSSADTCAGAATRSWRGSPSCARRSRPRRRSRC